MVTLSGCKKWNKRPLKIPLPEIQTKRTNFSYSILLVDDDPLVLRGLGCSLEKNNYQVTTAETGAKALKLIEASMFDLVITDLLIDQIDGLKVLRHAKNINPEAMVIILTGHANIESAIESLRLGADDYTFKPCESEEIFFRIDRCFEKLENKRKILKTEKDLRKAHKELERRIKERTAELEQTNKRLEQKTIDLEETNIALKVVLKRIEKDRKELEENMLFNINELVMPSVEKIKTNNGNENQKLAINMLENNLKEITSPLMRALGNKYTKLTPTEIQVANLIKYGKTSKEIADVMYMSKKTIDLHRYNIRKKLGLNDKKTNLRTHLMDIK